MSCLASVARHLHACSIGGHSFALASRSNQQTCLAERPRVSNFSEISLPISSNSALFSSDLVGLLCQVCIWSASRLPGRSRWLRVRGEREGAERWRNQQGLASVARYCRPHATPRRTNMVSCNRHPQLGEVLQEGSGYSPCVMTQAN